MGRPKARWHASTFCVGMCDWYAAGERKESVKTSARLVGDSWRRCQPQLQCSRHSSNRQQEIHARSALCGLADEHLRITGLVFWFRVKALFQAFFSSNGTHLCVGNDLVVGHVHNHLIRGLCPWEPAERQNPDGPPAWLQAVPLSLQSRGLLVQTQASLCLHESTTCCSRGMCLAASRPAVA